MAKDPIIEEIRKYRQKHAARFGFDPKKIAADARRRGKKSGRRIIPAPDKPGKTGHER